MSFTLGDLVGYTRPKAQPQARTPTLPERLPICCPLGKDAYATKADAQAWRDARERRNEHRRSLNVFRCDFGDHYHIGHRR